MYILVDKGTALYSSGYSESIWIFTDLSSVRVSFLSCKAVWVWTGMFDFPVVFLKNHLPPILAPSLLAKYIGGYLCVMMLSSDS